MATDLSARCDRALARAALFASADDATLTVVHAVLPGTISRHEQRVESLPSWRKPEPWLTTVARRLGDELSAEKIAAAQRVVAGHPAHVVAQAAQVAGAALIVCGLGHDDRLDRLQLGSTIDWLIREGPAPVLNVRRRARTPYRHVVVATDFSDASRGAVEFAQSWFGDARLTLFHAYEPPSTDLPESLAAEGWRAAVQAQGDRFMAQSGIAAQAADRWERLTEQGAIGALLDDLIATTGVDLVVMGSHGRSGWRRAMLGSTAETLLHSLDCDSLVVRAR